MTQVPPPVVDPAYKAAALQALATGGSQAKAALDQTKAALDASKAAMTGQALSEAARLNVSQPGRDQLASTISKPFDTGATALAARIQPTINKQATLAPLVANQFDTKAAVIAAKNAGKGGGGGGGSGGGGSGNWFTSDLKDQYDTKANLRKVLLEQGGVSTAARQAAAQFGVPGNVAQAWFPKTKTEIQTEQWLQQNVANRAPNKPVFAALAQQYGQGSPTYQYYTQLYQATPYAPKTKGK